jgi:DNA (cytosine-5)-methyltransferase 1
MNESDEAVTYGSLCSGYDGIGQGLTLAGLELAPLWMAETEPAMKRVLKREHDGVPDLDDIKAADFSAAGRVRVMSSGDPCQSISIAGRQEGRDDPRFLWPWVRDAYRQVWPDVMFFENVANIVSHDGGRTLAERHEHLREDGYEVRWTVLGACAVGAPHHRHRYYAVAVRVDGLAVPPTARRMGGKVAICGAPRNSGRVLLASPKSSDGFGAGTKRMEDGKAPWHDLPTHVALLPSPMARDGDGRGEGDVEYWRKRTQEQGRSNGIPLGAAVNLLPTPNARDGGQRGTPAPEHARRRAADPMRSLNLEDAVSVFLLPAPKATDGSNGGPNQRDGAGNYYLPGIADLPPTPTATNRHGNKVNNRGEHLLPGIVDLLDEGRWGKYAAAIALWEQVTGIPAPEPTEPNSKGDGRRLNPALPEWMMGLRPGLLTDELSRNEALKGAGNGVVPQAVAAAWRILMEGEQL